MRVRFSSSVYCKKYLQQIHFSNKIEPFSVQSVHELVLEFIIVTADTRKLRGDTAVETRATLKVVRTREKRVLIYWKIEHATLCSLPWTQVANYFKRDNILQLRSSNKLCRLPTTVSSLKNEDVLRSQRYRCRLMVIETYSDPKDTVEADGD